MSKVTILGAGAWGTALAIQACRAGQAVTLVPRDAAAAERMRQDRGSWRLPGVLLPEALRITDIVPSDTDLLFCVVPTQHIRTSLVRLPANRVPVVVCAKGVEAGTRLLPLEIVAEVLKPGLSGVLTGPNFAHEIAAGQPAATVVASSDSSLRDQARRAIGTPGFRVYGNDDPVGAQLGGAAKNVIAIAAGIVMGAGLGENARAALITRGLSELSRLTVALGGKAETVMGLSGLGDLLLTCTGPTSRNFSLGFALGQGQQLSDILAGRSSVTEGVTTAPALVARAGTVDMPICQAVAALLAGSITVARAMEQLLSRPNRDE